MPQFLHFFFLFFFIFAHVPVVESHTWSAKPRAYNTRWPTRDCRGRECTDACPSIFRRGMRNSQSQPAEVWRRGDTVRVSWVRNNHHGGMVRISVVPVAAMWDRSWHSKLTIAHTCWSHNEHRCRWREEDCGTDRNKKVFGLSFRLPTIYQNGDYVLGVVWYGGLHFQRKRGRFPDFYSCSFIRIEGGSSVGGSHQPFFESGTGTDVKNGKCLTSADRIGPCDRYGCSHKKSFYAIPKVFRGRNPTRITTTDVQNAMGKSGETLGGDRGICSGSVCCSSRCGGCGGRKCQLKPGGSENCCRGVIARSNRVCGRDPAPCVVR